MSRVWTAVKVPKDYRRHAYGLPFMWKKFSSDFKLGGVKRKGLLQTIFELLNEILGRICRYLNS